jgi:hypothetical protein
MSVQENQVQKIIIQADRGVNYKGHQDNHRDLDDQHKFRGQLFQFFSTSEELVRVRELEMSRVSLMHQCRGNIVVCFHQNKKR